MKMNPSSDGVSASGELALIEAIRRASAKRPMGRVRLGIGDDCAVLRPPTGHEVLVTTDLCLEGRHFRRDWHSAESAGHRCLARGLSDLAAMGATPLAAFLSLAVPAGLDRGWLNGFFAGMRRLADRYSVPLAGGDTASSPSEHLLADIVLIGSAPAGRALRRSTAQAGDPIYVTGALGGAAAELLALKTTPALASVRSDTAGRHPQLFPTPRLEVGATLLRRRVATACIDISDGLSTDLKHLCDASNLAAEIELDRLPMHPLADGRIDLALHGGEDYELLFAARPAAQVPRSIAGVPITRIGAFVRRGGGAVMTVIDGNGKRSRLKAGGWEHRIGGEARRDCPEKI
jgi:thiamine-monophosphate kinase